MHKSLGRKENKMDKFKNDIYYNPNVDYVKPNTSHMVPDFKRFTVRKGIINTNLFNDPNIDNTLVQNGYNSLSRAKRLHESITFD